jgi:hypothetical protein
MQKKIKRSTLVKNLDTIFSIYIRRKDAINDIAQCVTCGKKDHWSKLQNGHWASRRHYSTRWNEHNCNVQCSGCNVFRAGEIYLYTKYLCSKYGDNFPEELYKLSQKSIKFTDADLQDMIQHYKDKLKDFS